MIRALVVHPGTQHAFRLATELHRRKLLAGLHTGFGIPAGGRLRSLYASLPAGWQRRLGNRCWIGAKAVILKDVELGDSCVVGAGAVVTKSFPAGSVIVGVPARILP